MNKKDWLDAAEVFDAWRVVPRSLLFGYCIWVVLLTNNILLWYQHLPAAERSLETSGFAGVVITAVTGLATWVFSIYTAGGRDWKAEAGTVTSVTATTVTKETP